MKGCNTCKHYEIGSMQFNKPDIPHKCKDGNKVEFEEWWNKNGNRLTIEINADKSIMPCYKETILGELVIKAKEILDIMKSSK